MPGKMPFSRPRYDKETPFEYLRRILHFSTEAARQYVEYCRFSGEDVDPEWSGGMGLWQSFRSEFPPRLDVDRDMAIMLYGETVKNTVRSLLAFKPDGGKAEHEAAAEAYAESRYQEEDAAEQRYQDQRPEEGRLS